MAKFLSTRAVSAQIEQVISGASKYIVLASPFIRITSGLVQLVTEAAERGVRIIIAYGKKDLTPETKNQLKNVSKLELYFVQHLHAKCYFNEQFMIITSMNLFDFSEVNNWEMGVFVSKEKDEDLYTSASNEVRRILKSTAAKPADTFDELITPNTADATPNTSLPKLVKDMQKKLRKLTVELAPQGGVCIRCGDKIPTAYDKPYCKECYRSWLKYENYEYLEKLCHTCGKPAQTTIEYPLCIICYNKVANKFND